MRQLAQRLVSFPDPSQFYVACIKGLQIVPGRMWRLSPLITLDLREILPKSRHVGTDSLTTTISEHSVAEIKGDQTNGNCWHLKKNPVAIRDGLFQHCLYMSYFYTILVSFPNPSCDGSGNETTSTPYPVPTSSPS